MPVCTFCGQDNRDSARSCVACGFVFADGPTATAPLVEAGETTGVTPGEPATTEPDLSDAPANLAALYDPDDVAKPARQALVMLGLAAVLAIAAGIAVLADATDARDTIDEAAFVIERPTITPRTDLLTLAELSILAGVLVMLGGWTQQVAANRALLDVARPRHSPRWALTAWVIPGPNVVLPGVLARELWRDTAPPGAGARPSLLVGVWPALFGVALAGRYVGILYGLLSSSELKTAGDVTTATAILVAPLALWLLALAATVALVRSLTARQRSQAEALRAA